MAAGPLRISIVGDARDMQRSMGQAEDAMESAASTARTAGARIDTAFDSTAESADTVASKGAQAAGALSGLGDLVGGPFGAAMQAGGVAMQAFADAGDLLNVVTESAIVRKAKDIAVTAAHRAATIASTAATKAQAIATRALNLVMRGNPILLVVTALVALAAGLIYAYKHSETFRKIVNGVFKALQRVVKPIIAWFSKAIPAAWNVIKRVTSTVWNAVKRVTSTVWNAIKRTAQKVWNAIKGVITDPIGTARNVLSSIVGRIKSLLSGAWNTIKSVASNAWGSVKDHVVDGVRGAYDGVRNWLGKAVDFVRGIPGKIKSAFGRIWDSIAGSLKSAVNSILHLPLHIPTITLPFIGTIGGQTLIPALAQGGITTGPTVALIGDNPGGREAIVPLDKYDLTGSSTYNISVYVAPGGDLVQAGRQVVAAIDAYERAGGRRRAS